eukprot:TRINITY_DN23847_c0_g1_i1.p1 TRINITY_DN23847_c0_g1~~TRINITY_DN23847_c0_g1_i1.p1  ORF type:complete len:309 (+),score=59.88 TRINITY_DN23847_c0_g1_i1:72-998(+)
MSECLKGTQRKKDNNCTSFKSMERKFVAGAGGACLVAIFTTPFDVVKTRIQTRANCLTASQAFKCIYHNEGVSALWNGLAATFLLEIPRAAFYLTLYDTITHFAHKASFSNQSNSQNVSFLLPALSGLTARSITVVLTSPLEHVRTYLQSSSHQSGIIQTFRTIIHRGGFLALWTGTTVTLYRDVPFSAFYWSSFELLRSFFLTLVDRRQNVNGIKNNSIFWVDFASGMISGSTAAFLTTPIDLLKTRKQTGDGYRNESGKEMWSRVRSEGSGMFRGAVPRMAKVGPACAIMISFYETFKRLLQVETR